MRVPKVRLALMSGEFWNLRKERVFGEESKRCYPCYGGVQRRSAAQIIMKKLQTASLTRHTAFSRVRGVNITRSPVGAAADGHKLYSSVHPFEILPDRCDVNER